MKPRFLIKFQDETGQMTSAALTTDIYKEAEERLMSVPELINEKYPTNHPELTTFEQAQFHSGLIFSNDKRNGHKIPSMKEVKFGTANVNMAGIALPEGGSTDTLLPGARLLFGPTILEIAASSLMLNNSTYAALWDAAVATRVALTSPVYWTPVIDFNPPRASASGNIGQGEEPEVMASINVSQYPQRIGRRSIGLRIYDEALDMATIDLVGMTISQQGIGEQIRRLDEDVLAIINGATDQGTSALAVEYAEAYDSTLHGHPGTLTQKAWLQWLRYKWKYMNIDTIAGDLDAYLAVENRTGRPVLVGNPGVGRVDSNVDPVIAGIPDRLKWIPLDPGFIGTNKFVGFDSSMALRSVTWAGGTYSAMQEFVLTRETVFRFDVSQRLERIFPDGRAFRALIMADAP